MRSPPDGIPASSACQIDPALLEPIVDLDAWYADDWRTISPREDACGRLRHVGLHGTEPIHWPRMCGNWTCLTCAKYRVAKVLDHCARLFINHDHIFFARDTKPARKAGAGYVKVRRTDSRLCVFATEDLAGKHRPRWIALPPREAFILLRHALRLPGVGPRSVICSDTWRPKEQPEPVTHIGVLPGELVSAWIEEARRNPDPDHLREFARRLRQHADASKIDEECV